MRPPSQWSNPTSKTISLKANMTLRPLLSFLLNKDLNTHPISKSCLMTRSSPQSIPLWNSTNHNGPNPSKQYPNARQWQNPDYSASASTTPACSSIWKANSALRKSTSSHWPQSKSMLSATKNTKATSCAETTSPLRLNFPSSTAKLTAGTVTFSGSEIF